MRRIMPCHVSTSATSYPEPEPHIGNSSKVDNLNLHREVSPLMQEFVGERASVAEDTNRRHRELLATFLRRPHARTLCQTCWSWLFFFMHYRWFAERRQPS